MRSTWLIRAARSGLAGALLAATLGASVATAGPAPGRGAKRRGANLFALQFGVMNVNRWFCGINNIGELCVDPTNSPVVGGGFWPKGTPDQYIFNSGLQLGGQISSTAGFAWAGDTVGAFFMDPRGDQSEGDPITLVYNSLDAGDAANWPNGGIVRDTANYASVLQGRQSVSQEDLWVRTWEGNPAFLAGRTHPMGILVEERGMAWNFPTGNEDIIYFVFKFTNVTASDSTVYQNPTNDPAIWKELADIGADFQARNEARFNIQIPDKGYAFTNLYAAFFADEDVGDASVNYSTAIIPFDMMSAYKANFLEPNWVFPAEIFGPPFVASPGFVGLKFLKSPAGLTIFSNTLNSGTGYPDPVGVKQLYRYLSGTSSPAAGDLPCTITSLTPLQRHWCFQATNFADTRSFQSSGPFTLAPGETRTIVEAYIQAAPTPAVSAFVGGDFKPGNPETGAQIAADPTTVRPIERAMGWISQSDLNGDGIIEQNEVTSVPRSLLDKALVAQAVFDNKFLLPFAPDAPPFFLIPGDNQVTVVWQKSVTEATGDPFFAVASNPTSPLYDPNFRHLDVEGYRIYRGRTTSALSLVAQFDYANTSITDFTGGFAYTVDLNGNGKSECAPELGVFDDCPVRFQTTPPYISSVDHDLSGNVIQIPAGGRVKLADGSVLILKADTAVTGGGSGYPTLSNTGVNFAYVDLGVRNSFSYFYAVTAFDVNSLKSGPSSLESPRITKLVTPRAAGPNVRSTAVIQGVYGSDGTKLDLSQDYPAIDTGKGTFKGNIPPTNGASMLLSAAAVEALPPGDIIVRIDSLGPGFVNGIGAEPKLYLTVKTATDSLKRAVQLSEPGFNATGNTSYSFDQALVRYDSANARRFGIKFTQDVRMPLTFSGTITALVRASTGDGLIQGRYGVGFGEASRYLAHSRWFDATGQESQKDPTITAYADSFHNSGHLTGVGKIWSPQNYRDRWPEPGNGDVAGPRGALDLNYRGFGYASTAWYPADFLVTWNADSSLTVFDSTHHVTLPFAPNGGSGWGFVNVRAFVAAGIASTDLDETSTPTADVSVVGYRHLYGTNPTCTPDWWVINCALLERKAQYEPLDLNRDGAQDASGIALIINTEPFFMEMNAIPVAGTKWRLRAVSGTESATCTVLGTPPGDVDATGVGPDMSACSTYSFTGPAVRPALAPGLQYKITVQTTYAVDSSKSGDLSRVHTVPDPYYVTDALEATANTKVLKFVNLPSRAIVRIYSLSGVLVQVLTHNDQGGSGELTWNLRNRNNQFVASGVYFYHVEGPDGKTKVGRFTVVNFAP